jgi:hypothetical protein
MSNPPLRYVVLHHTGIDVPHFDLMVERSAGSPLATWRCAHWPPQEGDSLEPLAEHRREYLDYEGPVSGNRGEVRRVERGRCELTSSQTSGFRVLFESGLILELPIG